LEKAWKPMNNSEKLKFYKDMIKIFEEVNMEEKFPYEKIKRKTLIKRKAITNPKFKENRNPIEYGIVNINKFSGPTSHNITDYMKKILHIKKAGHSGTLVL